MVLNADARHIPLIDRSVHCVVTSPPYWGLRDYGVAEQLGLEPTPEEYVAALVAVFGEVWRVLRDDGTLWLNLGDAYAGSWGAQSRGATSQLADRSVSAQQILAMPKRVNTGSWVKDHASVKPKDLIGLPWMVAFALRADGWYLRSDIVWSKPNPMPESVTDRPTKAHEYLFLLAKRERYYYDAEAIKEPTRWPDGPNAPDKIKSPYGQGFMRYASGNKERKLDVPTRPNDHRGSSIPWTDNGSGRNRRSVWEIATQPYPEAHFATFPEALVEPCVLAGSPHGGLVLDPFAGSGTVGLVCQRLGRRFIGLELKPDYCRMATKRTAQMGLV